MRNWKEILWVTLLTILGIVCFPINPLVLTGIIDVKTYLPLSIAGWVVWVFGMILVIAPIVMFPRKGGVPKRKSFVHTTRLVDTGIYSTVRHPQYTGGIYAIFVATLLFYPHWLFGVLGVIGIVATYMGCRYEDRHLIKKFGNDYIAYMKKVPGMNIFLGIIRLLKSKTGHKQESD